MKSGANTFAGINGYLLVGTYLDSNYGLQKVMEVGTIVGDKVYMIQYIANASTYDNYLPDVQHMINSLKIMGASAISTNIKNIIASIGGAKKHDIVLDYDDWSTYSINVYVLVDTNTRQQSSKYLPMWLLSAHGQSF